jgi:hypothetical protein
LTLNHQSYNILVDALSEDAYYAIMTNDNGLCLLIFTYKYFGKRFSLNLVSAFRPQGSLDRRVNCHRVSQPRWVGAKRSTKGGETTKGKLAASVLFCAQVGCACSRGLQASARERERDCLPARSPARPTFSYESPGPSFYRRKERAQVYNGGCSSMLTCLVERS